MKKLFIISIIFVLLFSGVFGVLSPTGDVVRSTLSNSLSAVRGGGYTKTPIFILEPGDVIQSSYFENIGFDSRSIIFYAGDFYNNEMLKTGINEDSFFIKNNISTSIAVKAQIMCEQTGEELSQVIDNKSIVMEYEPTDWCGFEPCCVIIFERGNMPYVGPSVGFTQIADLMVIGLIVFIGLLLFGFIKLSKKGKSKTALILVVLLVLAFLFLGFVTMPVIAKPAIYLYPETDTQVQVNLGLNGVFTQTIPAYNNGWNVFVEKNGLIDNKYDYLFYEMKLFTNNYNLSNKGWIVKKDNLPEWFDIKLKEMGMNTKEINDFKEYWLEHLNDSKYYEIKLFSNDFLEKNLSLNINPKPDSILRLIFYFKPLDKPIQIEEPQITPFERKGFTVVEWGGLLDN